MFAGDDAAAEALLLLRNFEASGHGWFWSTDADGQLAYISDTIGRSLKDGELLGIRFADLFVQADDDVTGRRGLPFILAKQSPFEKIVLRAAEGE